MVAIQACTEPQRPRVPLMVKGALATPFYRLHEKVEKIETKWRIRIYVALLDLKLRVPVKGALEANKKEARACPEAKPCSRATVGCVLPPLALELGRQHKHGTQEEQHGWSNCVVHEGSEGCLAPFSAVCSLRRLGQHLYGKTYVR